MTNVWQFSRFFEEDKEDASCEYMIDCLIVLNTGRTLPWQNIERLFRRSRMTICADGAANHLHSFTAEKALVPNVICGDLDSIRNEVLQHMERRGSRIVHIANQDTTDFDKCLQYFYNQSHQDQSSSRLENNENLEKKTIVVLGGLNDGRFDQTMSNVNTLAKFQIQHPLDQLYMFTCGNSICMITSPPLPQLQKHLILCDSTAIDLRHCGLIPLVTSCDVDDRGLRVRASGLKWNLDTDEPLRFGGLISTSNQVEYDPVTGKGCIEVELVDGGGAAVMFCLENNIR